MRDFSFNSNQDLPLVTRHLDSAQNMSQRDQHNSQRNQHNIKIEYHEEEELRPSGDRRKDLAKERLRAHIMESGSGDIVVPYPPRDPSPLPGLKNLANIPSDITAKRPESRYNKKTLCSTIEETPYKPQRFSRPHYFRSERGEPHDLRLEKVDIFYCLLFSRSPLGSRTQK